MWLSMPNEILPFLNDKLRADLLDYTKISPKTVITNLYGGTTSIDTLTNDYMAVRLTEESSLQMQTLLTTDGDTIICLVHHYEFPEAESSVVLYNENWEKLSDIKFDLDYLVNKPDTMSDERYSEIFMMMDPYIIHYTLSESEKGTITVSIEVPLLTDEERKSLNAISMQRNYKWDGKAFN